jgi:hypothetical protein
MAQIRTLTDVQRDDGVASASDDCSHSRQVLGSAELSPISVGEGIRAAGPTTEGFHGV